jgi:hypothetical protein
MASSLKPILAVSALLVGACGTRHGIGVRAERQGDSYVFTFRPCDRPGEAPPRIESVRIDEKQSTGWTQVCEVTERDLHGSGAGPTWRYGTVPGGAAAEGCRPLDRAADFRLVLVSSPFVTIASFHLDGQGAVHMISEGCPR